MTLNEFLENYEGLIKVGAAQGSGYFYIGQADTLLDGMEVYDLKVRMYEKKRMDRSAHKLELMLSHPIEDLGDPALYKKALIEEEKQKRLVQRWSDSYNNHIYLGERQVMQTYPLHVYDEEYLAVIIDGDTFGAYWTADELKPGHEFKLASAHGGFMGSNYVAIT